MSHRIGDQVNRRDIPGGVKVGFWENSRTRFLQGTLSFYKNNRKNQLIFLFWFRCIYYAFSKLISAPIDKLILQVHNSNLLNSQNI